MQAVLEFRVAEAISAVDLEKLRERFAKLKWKADQVAEYELKLEVGGPLVPIQRVSGFQFTSPDAAQVILISKTAYGLTVLPPYPGWEGLLANFYEHHATWRKVVGKRRLGRIGCRYINRFDIPCPSGKIINIDDYMAFRTTEPDILDEPVRGLSMQVNSGIVADRLQVNLSTSTVDSPLVDHLGITLDIDIFREGDDVPQTDEDISVFLEMVRQRRTDIFEKCITDEMRRVIS